jgi:hypothetical protein
MNHNAYAAPFGLGDHLCYVGSSQWREPPAGPNRNPALVLTRGMMGVVILSSGDLVGEDAGASQPWRCQVQFRNGLQRDITPHNHSDFEAPQQSSRLAAPGAEPTQEPNRPQGELGNAPEGEPGNDHRDSRRGPSPETKRRNYCRARYAIEPFTASGG